MIRLSVSLDESLFQEKFLSKIKSSMHAIPSGLIPLKKEDIYKYIFIKQKGVA